MSSDFNLKLSTEEKRTLLRLARFTLKKWVSSQQYPSDQDISAFPITETLKRKAGVFVTLHQNEQLRGCIGFIEGQDYLYKDVVENAINAAIRDPRFPPVSVNELPLIDIEISVMTPLEEISGPDDIEIGEHGLLVEKGPNKGLLLPQVATEWQWDNYKFLQQTCQKAGLPLNAWKKDARLFRFSAIVFGEKKFDH